MNALLRFALWLFIGATYLAGFGFAIVFLAAASAVVWGPATTGWLLVLALLAFIGLSQSRGQVRQVVAEPAEIAEHALSFEDECRALAGGTGPLGHAFAPACVAIGRWWERRKARGVRA